METAPIQPLSLTDRDLLIRIDERQIAMSKGVDEIRSALLTKVDNDGDYKEIVKRVDDLWDWKNKVMGYSIAASSLVSIVLWLIDRFLLKG